MLAERWALCLKLNFLSDNYWNKNYPVNGPALMPYIFRNCIAYNRSIVKLLFIIYCCRACPFPETHKSYDMFHDSVTIVNSTAIHQLSRLALKPPYSIIWYFQQKGCIWQASIRKSWRSMFCETCLRQSFRMVHRFAENQPHWRFFMRKYECTLMRETNDGICCLGARGNCGWGAHNLSSVNMNTQAAV